VSLLPTVTHELEALVAQALSLPPEAVYTGPEPRHVPRNGLEVWLEPLRPQQPEPGVSAYLYALHLRQLVVDQAAGSFGAASLALFERADVLRAALDGARPFADRVPALIGTALEGGQLATRDQELSLELDIKAVVYD